MRAIQSDSKFIDQLERELIRREMNVLPLRSGRTAQAGATPEESGKPFHSMALTAFKGTLIVSAAVFVVITLALQEAARFS